MLGLFTKLINAMWNKGRDNKVVKDLVQIYCHPENIKPLCVEIHIEAIMGLFKFRIFWDFQLRAAQQSFSKAVVPSVANVSTLMTSYPLDRLPVPLQNQVRVLCSPHFW